MFTSSWSIPCGKLSPVLRVRDARAHVRGRQDGPDCTHTLGGGTHEPTASLATLPFAACPYCLLSTRRCDDGFRTVRPRNDLRHDQGLAGRHRPRRDRDRHEHPDTSNPARPSPTAAASTPFPTSRPAATTHGRAAGLQEISRSNVQLDAAGSLDARLHARDRRADRRSHRHRRIAAAADRRGAAQDGRGEGHRAAVVLRPQPDWRRRPQGGRRRRQLQQLQLLEPRQRRLQHQRQPQRREQHHGRRRDGDPHAFVGRHRRHPERRRDPGSPGADRRLHAGIRPRERRPDPHGHQERQQPLQRQRVVLLSATTSCRRTPGRATGARTRSRTAAPAPFDYKQYGYSLGGPIPVGC